VDTRTTPGHARELQAEIRSLTALPVEAVVNTHTHSDHCFGNATFDPVTIWGQRGAVRFLTETGERQRDGLAAAIPDLAAELRAVTLRPPDRLVDAGAALEVGGRRVELTFHGRAHTDHDLVVAVPDAGVVFAGDIIEEGAAPSFGDGYPVAWPATLDAFLAAHQEPIVVPGHGAVVDRAFVAAQRDAIAAMAALARRVAAGELTEDDCLAAAPFPAPSAREALARALLELGAARPGA
jgi:glyoxylase-like metal-dependent hydrolase (beta-lactamase superfamily II)